MGKFNCPIPINLLVRSLGEDNYSTDIYELLSKIDLFRWETDANGEFFLKTRLQIEAEMICRKRIGNISSEVEIAIALIGSANLSSYHEVERRFVLDLVRNIGPDGIFDTKYSSHYLTIATALTKLRKQCGINDASLMLQESTLRRRSLRDAPHTISVNPLEILDDARQIAENALSEFEEKKSAGLKRVCANLKVERAAIYGFLAVQHKKSGAPTADAWRYYEAARDSARTAIYALNTYHAIDISLWVPDDLLKEEGWSLEQQAELQADLWDGLERADIAQLDPEQREKFKERQYKVSKTLNDNKLTENALDSLKSLGSFAGIFLSAHSIGGSLNKGALSELNKRAQMVIDFFDHQLLSTQKDRRCLRYYIQALWIIATGRILFDGERSPLPHSISEAQTILDAFNQLSILEGALGNSKTEYMRAVLMWRLGYVHEAQNLWMMLEKDTAFSDPKRIIKHHVWTDVNKQPVIFHGKITHVDLGRDRLKIEVEELKQDIELRHRDFPDIEVRRGSNIPGGFHIAFNYIGPVADAIKKGTSK